MDDLGQPTNLKSVIPNFFYDVIAFILPAGWLIGCGLWIWYGQGFVQWLLNPVPPAVVGHPINPQITEIQSIGLAITGPAAVLALTAILLVYLGASSLAGYFLAALSNNSVEWLWRKKSKLDLDGLKRFMAADDLGKLYERFRVQFGFKLTNENLNEAGVLCSYYVWRKDANLGMMITRHNAEKLAAQSFVLVSAFLLFEVLAKALLGRSIQVVDIAWAAVLLACLIASALAFGYHRKKRVYGRFQMYLAMVCESERGIFS
jgi:hypothetical protein